MPVDPQMRTGTLANGLRYYMRANARPEQRAELRLVVNAGSVLEDDDQRGYAHFVEHMAFNGTEHFPEQEHRQFLQSLGMRLGADLNASTSFDQTIYKLEVPTDTPGRSDRRARPRGLGAPRDVRPTEHRQGAWRHDRGMAAGAGRGPRMRDTLMPMLWRLALREPAADRRPKRWTVSSTPR